MHYMYYYNAALLSHLLGAELVIHHKFCMAMNKIAPNIFGVKFSDNKGKYIAQSRSWLSDM